MSESFAIEVYENECFDRRKRDWTPHKECPFVMKTTFTACKPLDEITLPADNEDAWQWATNWKISKMPGVTDADGWEYASRFSRFKKQERAPKSEAVWSRARRRLWIRIMRRETSVKASDISKVLPKIQLGLSSVHSARVKIEEIMKHAPEAAGSDQMRSLVTSVNRNIAEIIAVIDQAEKNFAQEAESNSSSSSSGAGGGTNGNGGGRGGGGASVAKPPSSNSPAVLKKLRNDVMKEQGYIEKALEGRAAAIPISATGSNTKGNVTTSSSYAGSMMSGSVLRSSQSQRARGEPTPGSDFRQDLTSVNQIVSSKKSAIKSGSAGAFNPSMFVNQNPGNIGADGPEDGVFVDRTTHDLLIEQKLIPVDEMTVMQEIIDDRHNEIQKINKGIVEINDMFTDLSKLVKEQEIEVQHIYDNIEESHTKTKEAFAHIVEASSSENSSSFIRPVPLNAPLDMEINAYI